jgi:hypothetical protein
MKKPSIGPLNRFIPLIMITAGALLMAAAMLYGLLTQQPTGSASAPLPLALAGLEQIEAAYGEEAIAGISQMHGQDFELVSGAIGNYAGAGASSSATLWVSGVASDADAAALVVAMRERIALGQSPFTPLGEHTTGSQTVYELAGMGQQHFYFQSGKLVIWLAVDPPAAETVLQAVLDFYD